MDITLIFGPTAVGKTTHSLELAQQEKGEIISADSMQVYRGMDIGTAKLSVSERQGIPHHLIDVVNPDEPWSVAHFVREAHAKIQAVHRRGRLPIVVGGTGLYLWALLEGIEFSPLAKSPEIREGLYKISHTEGSATLYQRLQEVDPARAQKIHPHDTQRLVRALEVYELTGKPISSFGKGKPLSERYRLRWIGLTLERDELYRRIEERVDRMLTAGLVKEVQGLLNHGYSKDLPSMQALGYKEVIRFLGGEWDEETMIAEFKKRTRHFAKRQMTWFRRLP